MIDGNKTEIQEEPAYLRASSLTQLEKDTIMKTLGRYPNREETAALGVEWSEHCSYKSSKRWFKQFYTQDPRVIVGIGEGAGLIDIGEDWIIGFRIESHNHPSAISPFEGAATGIGGIIRDVISQGCYPIALMDPLRFGDLKLSHTRYLLENVVRGISSYGNCMGIPNAGGELEFSSEFNENPLVNVVCVGITQRKNIIRSIAKNVDDYLILFGATTGRDGIHGASFASEDLSDKSSESRSAVQIGDPLKEKIVLDALKELQDANVLNACQDFGGGGLTTACSEIVERGGTGVEIYLDKIPLRVKDMEPWEILISESQERMLVVVSPAKLDQTLDILAHHDLDYAVVGRVINERVFRAFFRGKIVTDLPVHLVANGVPEPSREIEVPNYYKMRKSVDPKVLRSFIDDLLLLLESPNIADKSWVYEQYDKTVQGNSFVPPGYGASIIHTPNNKLVALVTETNSFKVYLDPYHGSAESCGEAYRRLVSVGAEPLALQDCLNFGNPEKPDSYWQFTESIRGIAKFTNDIKIPIVGGNVSLYNEATVGGKRIRVLPVPTIVMIGLIDKFEQFIPNRVQNSNGQSLLVWIGELTDSLAGTEYYKHNYGILDGLFPKYNSHSEKWMKDVIFSLRDQKLILSSRCLSRGGVIVTALRMLFDPYLPAKNGLKLEKSLDLRTIEARRLFFGEHPANYIIEITQDNLNVVKAVLEKSNVSYRILGGISLEKYLEIGNEKLNIEDLRLKWLKGIRKYFE